MSDPKPKKKVTLEELLPRMASDATRAPSHVPAAGPSMQAARQGLLALPRKAIPQDAPHPTDVPGNLAALGDRVAEGAALLPETMPAAGAYMAIRAAIQGDPLKGALAAPLMLAHTPGAGAAADEAATAIRRGLARTERWSQPHAEEFARIYEGLPLKDPKAEPYFRRMASEVDQQFAQMKKEGIKVEFTTTDPYRTSKEMMADVRDNKRLRVFRTPEDFQHPFLSPSENDKFRAVHDYFGHFKEGNPFSALGEENAYRAHSQMFSPEAARAMATETRGQNSWFNAGPHSKLPASERPFAQQKGALWPESHMGEYSPTAPVEPAGGISKAAIRSPNGEVYTGKTHLSAMEEARGGGHSHFDDFVDGFVTDDGRFVDREEAFVIAEKAGQLPPLDPEEPWLGTTLDAAYLPGGSMGKPDAVAVGFTPDAEHQKTMQAIFEKQRAEGGADPAQAAQERTQQLLDKLRSANWSGMDRRTTMQPPAPFGPMPERRAPTGPVMKASDLPQGQREGGFGEMLQRIQRWNANLGEGGYDTPGPKKETLWDIAKKVASNERGSIKALPDGPLFDFSRLGKGGGPLDAVPQEKLRLAQPGDVQNAKRVAARQETFDNLVADIYRNIGKSEKRGAVERGVQMGGHNFYDMNPVVEDMISVTGEPVARSNFDLLAKLIGGTSPSSPVPGNVARALLLHPKVRAGQLDPAVLLDPAEKAGGVNAYLPKGVQTIASKTQGQMVDQILRDQPWRTTSGQAKLASFDANTAGNFAPFTGDRHAARISFNDKSRDGFSPLEYAAADAAWTARAEEAAKRGALPAQPGKSPVAPYQGVLWMGDAPFTGVASDPRALAQVVDDQIGSFASQLGLPKKDVWRRWNEGDTSLLGNLLKVTAPTGRAAKRGFADIYQQNLGL